MYRFLLPIFSLFLLSSLFKENFIYNEDDLSSVSQIAIPHIQLQTGDLILRDGRGFISEVFKSFSLKDPKYSHAGLINIENGKIYVYHALGGEENVSNKLKKESLVNFCNSKISRAFAIYRYDLTTDQKQKLSQLVKESYTKKLEFDKQFDIETDDAMYCSEFIYKVITKATDSRNYLSTTDLKGIKYIAIDNLYYNQHCKLIYNYNH